LRAGDDNGLSSRTVFLLSRMSRSSEGVQEPPVCEVDPLDIAGQAVSCAISIELMG
jgi:hypothetical protein